MKTKYILYFKMSANDAWESKGRFASRMEAECWAMNHMHDWKEFRIDCVYEDDVCFTICCDQEIGNKEIFFS